jgi:ArsR family transcriptional regulator, arsenate/arsenite/antimonite-responsive transcriptional repressor
MFATYKIIVTMHAKTKAFEPALQDLALMAKLLAHPARIAIITLLAEKKSCISGDIAQELPLSRATVCQHLQELKNAGLIKGDINGLYVNYCLDAEKWAAVRQQFESFFLATNQHIHCNC